MPQAELQCPFCDQTSPRPQGLASHIRSRHPKQYPKWLKTPTRLADAQTSPAKRNGKSQAEADGTEQQPSPVPETVQAETLAPAHAANGNHPLDLLKKAHAQLLDRKQKIESEITRLDGLTKELEGVNTQIEALDKTLTVFEPQPV